MREAVGQFGASAKSTLSNPSVTGQPEDQLRPPLVELLKALAEIRIPGAEIAPVGETPLDHIKTRPDYAVTVSNVLVGFIEVKAPGKGANPARFKDKHDRDQWSRLKSVPNLIYTDGNEFSLWSSGEPVGNIVRMIGDIETSGAALDAPEALLDLVERFLRWEPIPPRDAKELAATTARLCRLLREDVADHLSAGAGALPLVAHDWRKMLFPDATDAEVADGYAQAVTFGMLVAKAQNAELSKGLSGISQEFGNTLIGTALRLLAFDGSVSSLPSIRTLVRVVDAVDWGKISHGNPEAWLYFYEDFLAVYDNKLRKETGSYYTPTEVVHEMVRLVDDVLRSRFNQNDGLASRDVTLIDPAVGTGTFLLSVLRKIAATVEEDKGAGAVAAAIDEATKRVLAFEVQLGPFAVAQVRMLAEVTALTGQRYPRAPRMYVTDTLSDPHVEEEWLPFTWKPIGESRKEANRIKKHERIMVVLGNPPYKEKAMGRGGWIEDDSKGDSPLSKWMPPADWGVGAHAKHLRNLYVYFWRWATWKVFDQDAQSNTGIVCFITVAGFLNGPGFQRMRDYLRRTTDEVWIIDCSPEGHQPDVNTRVFQGVQHPVCIVLASRSPQTDTSVPARVMYRSLPEGDRKDKFKALKGVDLDGGGWSACSSGWRDPFLPAAVGAWATYPALSDMFVYSGSGVMPGRTWVIAPDAESLDKRWKRLIAAPTAEKEKLFHPHLRNGKSGDKHVNKVVEASLAGHAPRKVSVAKDQASCNAPTRYGFRSFDRQWIIPDSRVINQPNTELWKSFSDKQVFLTAITDHSPSAGPAVTMTGMIPDLHHYNGRGGRAFPLWLDAKATVSNVRPKLLVALSDYYSSPVSAEDLFCYVAAVTAHSAFIERFQKDLSTPGLRVPITASNDLFREAVEVGRTVVWLHTFGERFTNPGAGRPKRCPAMSGQRPKVPRDGAIGMSPDEMPESISYDDATLRLLVGNGWIEGVTPAMWNYEVSGVQVVRHWFSYRKADRTRPIIGDRRPPSELGTIQPDHWLAEYTEEILQLLNVLGRVIDLEPVQAKLLKRICEGDVISVTEFQEADAFSLTDCPTKPSDVTGKAAKSNPAQTTIPLASASQKRNKK